MKRLIAAVLIAAPTAASADGLEKLLSSDCAVLSLKDAPDALSEDVAEAYRSLTAAWMIVTDAAEIFPDPLEVCAANPDYTVEEALRASIKAAR